MWQLEEKAMERTVVRIAERERIALVGHHNLKGELLKWGWKYERILRHLGSRHAEG